MEFFFQCGIFLIPGKYYFPQHKVCFLASWFTFLTFLHVNLFFLSSDMIVFGFGQTFILVLWYPTRCIISIDELCMQVQQASDVIENYYTYWPIADADGHFSPFTAPGVAAKSRNMSIIHSQSGWTQEVCT
jgi:hypothetical protein